VGTIDTKVNAGVSSLPKIMLFEPVAKMTARVTRSYDAFAHEITPLGEPATADAVAG
jgi:hypothetical protein